MQENIKTISTKSLVEFLSTGKTIKEIANRFSILPDKARERVLRMNEVEKYELFQHRNKHGEEIFVCFPQIIAPQVKPRIWKYRMHPTKPYLWISLPDSLDFEKIKIRPLSDIHYGEKGHLDKLFMAHVNWIARTDNVFCFLNGDLTANALKDSPGTAIFQQIRSPRDQMIELTEILRPIAHKILWSLPGGHEFRSISRTDFDPSEWICRELDIPHFSGPANIDILWKGYNFIFYCKHGEKTPGTEGGKLNKAVAPLKIQEFVMFVICGHFHDPTTNKVHRMCRERTFDESGKLVSFKLIEKKQYVVICPSFFGYYGTYAAQRDFPPGSSGVIDCRLYANGDYHATRSDRKE